MGAVVNIRANKGTTEDMKRQMWDLHRKGWTQVEIAALFDLSQVRVSQILREVRRAKMLVS